MGKRIHFFLFIMLCLFGISSYAQKTVTGLVTDSDGSPLIGVTILEKGTSTGTVTSFDGSPAYNRWPLGYVAPLPYLSGVAETMVDAQVVERRITCFLGDQDVVTTGSLNTSDCEAVLLGENRFRRGENIFRLM